jgi:MFS family permease
VPADLPSPVGLAPRTLLALAAVAVGFAAADTYVVVLALPDMMGSVGLNVDELQRAAPIVSGFLLGYIAMLPLMGRIADLRGRVPVLVGSLIIFSVGSLVTAASYDLVTMVVGRFLQGVGGGGLVPATLALVADIWAVDQRGVPLGVIGAVQELGSVLGPLYGALVLSQADWQAIFWINLAVGLALAAALVALRGRQAVAARPPEGAPDVIGAALALGSLSALALVMLEPDRLMRGVTTGLAFIPRIGDTRWTTWMAFGCYLLAIAFIIRQLTARRPLLQLRSPPTTPLPFASRGRRPAPERGTFALSRDRLPTEGGLSALASRADLIGATLLGLSLAGIVLAFATADPEVQVFSAAGPWLLAGSVIFAGLFGWRQRIAPRPLVPLGALSADAAWGSLAVSFFVGAALIAALVDIPIFARVTVYPDSQLGAALVLVRLLAALPVGALLGGYLLRRFDTGPVAAAGMTLAALGFAWMAQWDKTSLDQWTATLPLVLCGLGFGLAVAPVNSALLAATRAEVHGIASALLVVARMVGMLVGISALTTIGLRRFYAVSADVPPVRDVCGADKACDAYLDLLKDVGVAQVHAIFWGAAACAVVAALLSVTLLRPPVAERPRVVA